MRRLLNFLKRIHIEVRIIVMPERGPITEYRELSDIRAMPRREAQRELMKLKAAIVQELKAL